MKKQLVLILVCGLSLSTFAQTEKKEKEYLPVQGDISLGINLIPLVNYFGNMFNNSTSNTLEPGSIGGNAWMPTVPGLSSSSFSIFGKYFLTDKTAVRVNLGLQVNSLDNKFYANDQAALALDPLSVAQVEDKYTMNKSGVSIALGYEWRRGYKRLQGYWGGQLLLAYSEDKNTITYGNGITELNQMPETNIPYTTTPTVNVGGNSRLLSYNDGGKFVAGIGGFVGVEYYIAPKLSIGCELSLNLLFQTSGREFEVSERFNDRFNQKEQNTRNISPGKSGIHFGTENIGTSLFMAFSF